MTSDAEIQSALPALSPGNVAVITGSASGIGLAAAKRLAARRSGEGRGEVHFA